MWQTSYQVAGNLLEVYGWISVSAGWIFGSSMDIKDCFMNFIRKAIFIYSFIYWVFILVLKIEVIASHMLSKYSTTELYP